MKGVFTTPWSATVTYGRPLGQWLEHVCAENTFEYYNSKELGRSDGGQARFLRAGPKACAGAVTPAPYAPAARSRRGSGE